MGAGTVSWLSRIVAPLPTWQLPPQIVAKATA